jgi:hypothetical protein
VNNENFGFDTVRLKGNDSLYIDSTGRVGFRTSTPVLDLHVEHPGAAGLEQNNSGGKANFFVRDLTGGSRLPFRIRPQQLATKVSTLEAAQPR